MIRAAGSMTSERREGNEEPMCRTSGSVPLHSTSGRRRAGRAAAVARCTEPLYVRARAGALWFSPVAFLVVLESLTPEKRAEYQQRMARIDSQFPPPPRGTVKDFVDHIDYAVKLIGIDHIGISSDFDGGGGLEGYNDATEAINVTRELVRRGYTEPQIAKLWS